LDIPVPAFAGTYAASVFLMQNWLTRILPAHWIKQDPICQVFFPVVSIFIAFSIFLCGTSRQLPWQTGHCLPG